MTSSYWDDYPLVSSVEPLIEAEGLQANLERPTVIINYEDELGNPQVWESEADVEPGDEKHWAPDDTIIAIAYSNSDQPVEPFRDPTEQAVVQGMNQNYLGGSV